MSARNLIPWFVVLSAAAMLCAPRDGRGQPAPDERYSVGAGMRSDLDYYDPYQASREDPYDSFKDRLPPVASTPVPGAAGGRIAPRSYPAGRDPYYDMRSDTPYYDSYGRVKYGPRELPETDPRGAQIGRDWYRNMPYRNPPRGGPEDRREAF
ncbi:MAG: hypothetical protein PHN82_05240 [bacterium]|nr:hypothetical protein [bacterium]